MRIIQSTVLSCLLVISNVAQSAPAAPQRQQLEVNPKRAMVIDGVISSGNISHLGDLLLSMDNSGPIDIVISSPGGDVVTGFSFVTSMKAAQARGRTLRCFVTDVAASMAFQILVNCDERYTLDRAFLLWHRARVYVGGIFGAPMTAPAAQHLSTQLEMLDSMILNETNDALDTNKEWVSYHFEHETLHVGKNLAESLPLFIQSRGYIPGLLETLKNQKVPRSKTISIFGLEDLFRPGEIIYIRRGLVD